MLDNPQSISTEYMEEPESKDTAILKSNYRLNRAAKTGEEIPCVICDKVFIKKTYHHVFCCTPHKDMYWNTVDETRRDRATLFNRR